MSSSLRQQAEQAPAFVAEAWPALRSAARAELEAVAGRLTTVVLCGCGDSHHAASSLEHAFRAWAGKSALGLPAMHAARYLVPEIGSDSGEVLLIGISASGESARTLEALQLGGERGLRTLAITSQAHSSLSELADHTLAARLPDFAAGPGLISYLASLMAGFALASQLAPDTARQGAERAIAELPELLSDELGRAWPAGAAAADQLTERLPITFLGSGPAYGTAMFSAAKVLEAAGWPAWAQEAEEWAHLEYFADPPELPLWLLSAAGRSASRESELQQAAEQIGRRLFVSQWEAGEHWPGWARETLSPLALWIGPVAFADSLMGRAGETPFRGFGGGRSADEGGGANRVRSSRRIASLKELEKLQSAN